MSDWTTTRMPRGQLMRSLCAYGAGVGTMLIAVAVRDGGTAAIDFWMIGGAVGMVALFSKSLDV